jgi:uncharacterized membrane-anchored protein YitT (DUF2179 family)
MKNLFYILIGSILFSFGVASIASPQGLVSGGFSGIGIILKEISGNIPIALTSFVLNIPLFAISFFERGFKFISKSLFAFSLFTVFTAIFENLPYPEINDVPVASLLYGVLVGSGLGLVLKSGATSGGTDMLASIIKRKKPHLKISFIILVIDAVIILSGIFVFGIVRGAYATLSLVISVRVMDAVVLGVKTSKAVFIISKEYSAISQDIIEVLGRGVTEMDIRGGYTGNSGVLLFAVISPRELTSLRKIVSAHDKTAFVTVTDAREVLGEGFESLVLSQDALN